MYGRGLDLVIADKTTRAADVAKAITDLHAIFRVCAIAMKNQQLDKSRLLPNVEIVPDGIGGNCGQAGRGVGLYQGRTLRTACLLSHRRWSDARDGVNARYCFPGSAGRSASIAVS
jgi:hypothetical protein